MPESDIETGGNPAADTSISLSGDNNKLTDEQFRELAAIVYKLIAEDLKIERERRGRR
jgi:hypothetical protein